MRRVVLLATLMASAAVGCAQEAGRFELTFVWPDGYPEALIGTEARVTLRVEAEGRVLSESSPTAVTDANVRIPLDGVPNGPNRVALLEVRESQASESALILYGLSEPFDLNPGEVTEVRVRVDLGTPPTGGAVQVVPTGVAAVPVPVNDPVAQLILQTDTGVTALISNRSDFAPGDATDTITLRNASGDAPSACANPGDRADLCRFTVSWNLDSGVGACVDPVSCRRRVYVRFGDALGVLGRAIITEVIVDLVPPVVVERGLTVTPTAAKQVDEIIAQVPFSEPVTPGSVVLTVGGSTTGEQLFPEDPTVPASSYTYSLGRGDAYGDVADLGLHIAAVDLAGNRSTNAGVLARVRVDGLEPTVSIRDIEPGVVSLNREGLSFGLDVSESLEDGGIDVTFAPITPFCGRDCFDCEQVSSGVDGSEWSCTTSAAGIDALQNLADGVQDIFPLRVEARDAADNRGNVTANVSVDLLPPALAGQVGVIRQAPNDLRGAPPTALATGAFLQVSLAVTETLRSAALVMVGQGRQVEFREVSAAGASFVYELDVPSLPNGEYELRLRAEDLVGNDAELTVPIEGGVIIDNSAPAAPTVSAGNRIVFRRAPWGESALGTPNAPRFTVRGGRGAVEANGIVRVYQSSGAFATRIVASADGSFPETDIDISDATDVELSVVDGAGNESARAATRFGEWHAALTRLNGDSLSTPHQITTSLEHQVTLVQPPVGRGTAVLDDDVDRLGRGDGRVLTVASSPVWFEAPTVDERPELRDGRAGAAFDRERGRLVLFGGNPTTLGSVSSNRIWEWDGARWEEIIPISALPPPTLNPGLAWHGGLGVTVMQGSGTNRDETWTWDGSAWREVSPAGSGPSGNRIAYDRARGVVVLHNGASTWEWNGTWVNRTPAGGLPDEGPMYFDAARGRVRLVTATNLYEWNGASWTSIATTGARPSTSLYGAVYDEARQRAVVVYQFEERAELVGSQWTTYTLGTTEAARPPLSATVYDPIRERTLVLSASAEIHVYEQGRSTELDGSVWDTLTSIEYDHQRSELVGTDGSRTYVFNGIGWRDAGSPPPGEMMWDPGANALLSMGSLVYRWTGTGWSLWGLTTVPATPYEIFSGGPPGTGARSPILIQRNTDQTYEWQASSWVLRSSVEPPCDNLGPTLYTVDPIDQVLFAVDANATCEWASGWTNRTSAPPVVPFPVPNVTWDALRGRRHSFSGGVGTMSPFFATDAESWFFNEEWASVSPRLSVTPAARVYAQFAIDYGNNATWMVGGFNDFSFNLSDAWRLGRDPLPRPAVLTSFDLRSLGAGVEIDEVTRVQIDVRAGGTGHTTIRPGSNGELVGFEVVAWNAQRSRWDVLRSVATGNLSTLATTSVTLSNAAIRPYVTGRIPELRLAIRTRGVDYRDRRATLSVDYVTAEVDYQR